MAILCESIIHVPALDFCGKLQGRHRVCVCVCVSKSVCLLARGSAAHHTLHVCVRCGSTSGMRMPQHTESRKPDTVIEECVFLRLICSIVDPVRVMLLTKATEDGTVSISKGLSVNLLIQRGTMIRLLSPWRQGSQCSTQKTQTVTQYISYI